MGSSPAVSTITPNSLEQGHTVTLSLTGSRLAGLTEARFDAAGLSAQILPGGTSTQAALSVTATATATVGATALTLFLDAGELRIPVAITVERALPVIASLAPASLVAGQGATEVALNGRNFTGQSVVLVNGNPATSQFLSTTQLRADVANQDSPGNLLFSVRTPDLVNAGQFLVSNEASLPVAPAQLALSPALSSVPQGASRTLTLTLPFAAPAGGLTFDLVSSVPAVVSVPAALTVPQGGTSVAFQLTAAAVGATTLSASKTGFVSGQAQISVFAACPAAPSGLVGWWPGEGTANDNAGTNHGTLQNGVTFAAGKVRQAFNLDGVNDYADLGSAPAFDLGDFTIHAWVSVDPATNTGERRIVSRDDVLVAGNRQLYTLKSSSPSACGGAGNRPAVGILKGSLGQICAPAALSAGFHHLAAVRSGTTISLYVDGALAASQVTGISGTIAPAAPLTIGQVSPAYNGEYFKGLIDEAALHNRALTSDEISGVFSAGSTGMCKQTYVVTPVPLALPPDSVARRFTIEASIPVSQAVSFTATTLNTAIALAGTETITLPVGATQAAGTVTGIAAGSTILRLTSPALIEPIDIPLAVTPEFASATVVHMRPLGLAKGAIATPAGANVGPYTAPVVGIVKGNPAAPEANTPSGPLLAAPLGLIKGNPAAPEANTPSGPLLAAPLGLIKGNPTSPSASAAAGPVLSTPVGLQKP